MLIKNTRFVADRMKADKPIAECHIRVFKQLPPGIYSLLKKVQLEETFEVYEKYKDHEVYRTEMELLLSPKGKE